MDELLRAETVSGLPSLSLKLTMNETGTPLRLEKYTAVYQPATERKLWEDFCHGSCRGGGERDLSEICLPAATRAKADDKIPGTGRTA
jgi:hypothetical protein